MWKVSSDAYAYALVMLTDAAKSLELGAAEVWCWGQDKSLDQTK